MTLLEFLTKYLGLALPNVPSVADVLKAVEAKFPDSKGLLEPLVAALNVPIDIVALGGTLPPEALNILKGVIDSREHSGDSV